MINHKKVLAFIGARSGSKGLVDKNIKDFCGKPLIAWTIIAAKNSAYVDDVVVSTDSPQYAEIAKCYGAKVIIRPDSLATDQADLMAALKHSVATLAEQQQHFDIVVNLQPTSPLRTSEHVSEALNLFTENYQDDLRVFSCYQVLNKYAWIMRCNEHGFANFIDNQQVNNNHARQKNGDILLPNGAIFILSTHNLTTFYNGKTLPYVMSKESSIDIDTIADFLQAQQIMKASLAG